MENGKTIDLNDVESTLVAELRRRIQAGEDARQVLSAVIGGIAARCGLPLGDFTISPDNKQLILQEAPNGMATNKK